MILYRVNKGVISVMSVVRETHTGWRLKNGGFVNQNRLSEKYPSLTNSYYTTEFNEAWKWSKIQTQIMTDILQVAQAAISDVLDWHDNGANEDHLPKPRD